VDWRLTARTAGWFVGVTTKMMAVVDADSGKGLATPAIGEGVDATTFDAENWAGFRFLRRRRSAHGGERRTRPTKFSVAEKRADTEGARTLALDAKTHNVFVVTAQFGPRRRDADNPRPRPPILPDSFVVLVVGK